MIHDDFRAAQAHAERNQDEITIASPSEDVPSQPLTRVNTNHLQAIMPTKPRDVDACQSEMVTEAAELGEEAYYDWMTKSGDYIVGIAGPYALDMMRMWGNCALHSEPAEYDANMRTWTYRLTFIDTERCVAIPREEHYTPLPAPGAFAKDPGQADRWRRMQFNIGQTIAMRNAILKGGIPRTVQRMVVQAARDTNRADIIDMGPVERMNIAVSEFGRFGVSATDLIRKLGKPLNKVTVDDVEFMKSLYGRIQRTFSNQGRDMGQLAVEEAFPVRPIVESAPPAVEQAPPPPPIASQTNGDPPRDTRLALLREEFRTSGLPMPSDEDLNAELNKREKKAEARRVVVKARNARNHPRGRRASKGLMD